MIRVAFRYNDTRLFPRLVTLLRGGDSAHCEAANRWRGQYHTCTSASFMDGGVRQKTIELTADKWRIYEITDVSKLEIEEWFQANKDKKYDVVGLLGFVWRRITGSKNKLFCSEAVAEMIGLDNPHLYDLMLLESVCARLGRRVQ